MWRRIAPKALSLVLPILFASACSHGSSTRGEGPIADRVADLVQELRSGKIGKIEILGIAGSVEFIGAATPDMLESDWQYKITIRRVDGERLENLIAALNETRLGREAHPADLRVGVFFYSSARGKEEERLSSLYFDRTGRRGAFNNVPVTFDGRLYNRLKAILCPPYA
jgi:hypothetical protein